MIKIWKRNDRGIKKEWGITKENSADHFLLDREDKNKKTNSSSYSFGFYFFNVISVAFCQESWSKFMETLLNIVPSLFLIPYQPSFNSQMPLFFIMFCLFLYKSHDFKPLNRGESSFSFWLFIFFAFSVKARYCMFFNKQTLGELEQDVINYENKNQSMSDLSVKLKAEADNTDTRFHDLLAHVKIK